MSAPAPTGAERQARRCLAAFPWRDRAERGGEIVGTVLDALPPDADRLPARTAVDLVRGGLRTRRQRRPPWPTRWHYRAGGRLGPEWRRWVFDDVEDPHYRRNARLRLLAAYVVATSVLVVLLDPVSIVITSFLLVQIVFVGREQRLVRERHGLRPGGIDPTQAWVRRWSPPSLPNVGVVVLAAGIGLPLALGGAACLWAVTHQRSLRVAGPDLTLWASPAPADIAARLRPTAGVALAAALAVALLGIGLVAARRRTPPAGAEVRIDATRVVAGLVGGAIAMASAVLATTLHLSWASASYAHAAAVAAPLGVVLLLVAAVATVAARRRGRPVALWDVVTHVGPRSSAALVPAAYAAHYPPEDRWVEAERAT